jgi:spermidine/putrescine ABC transporter ATP-binding subunit
MSAVAVSGVTKRYGETAALDHVSLDFADGSFCSLLGPSGSGKTTLLRAIAGFIEPDSGAIAIGGVSVENIPVRHRGIGMVFQNYALFPHMTVGDNVAFGLSVRGAPAGEITRRVRDMLALVQLEGFEERKPRQLSGGQQQRVALARALVTEPKVLLLDEPLGALDRRLREEMQIELRQIQRTVGITTIFVTHDQEEALTLSDRIAIIDEGRVVQVGVPNEVYERPETAFAARFLGDANFMTGSVGAGGVVTTAAFGPVRTADPLPDGGETVMLAVRPEKMRLAESTDDNGDNGDNRIHGAVRQTVFSGNSVTYIVAAGDETIRVFAQNRGDRVFDTGDAVTVQWSARHSVVVKP